MFLVNERVIGWEMIRAAASRNVVSATKSRSSALSCSVRPETGRVWNPVICER